MLPIADVPPLSSPRGWRVTFHSLQCPEGPASSQPGWPYLHSPSAHSWLDLRRTTWKWLQIVRALQECAKQAHSPALCSCLSAEPGLQPGQWGTVAPLTWFRSHLTAQTYRQEPRKTLTCHKGRDWQAKPGHPRGVGWCLMAHSCWAIRNTGISFFKRYLIFSLSLFPCLFKIKPHRSEMCSWYLPSWEEWISNYIVCWSTAFLTHLLLELIEFSSGTHQWPFSQAPRSFGHPGPGTLPTVLEAPLAVCAPLHLPAHGKHTQQCCAGGVTMPSVVGWWLDGLTPNYRMVMAIFVHGTSAKDLYFCWILPRILL